ncbi:protein phosphatase 2C homolog 7, mitochondrial [Diutina catenulata]
MISLVGKRAFTGTLKHAVQTAPKVQSARRFSFSSWNSNKNHPASGAASSQHSNYDGIHTGFSHYDIQVAFQPKDREEQGQNLFAHKKNGTKPKAPQYSPSGEDNLFVSHEVNGGFVACGVADGVGGWSEAGYDSSAISRELCRQMKHQFEATDGSVAPAALLQSAFDAVQKSPEVDIGGTTACLGVLTPDRKLTVANLGDSWCGVFRDYALVEETKFQTHNFNTPYQLAKIPKHIIAQAEKEGRRYIIDSPSSADSYTWQLQSGDVVMFATDGVTDNIVPGDIEVFLRDQLAPTDKPASSLADTAKTFVQEVVKVSKDPNFPSAFAQELSKLTGQRYLGGKEDDITVVVVKVN